MFPDYPDKSYIILLLCPGGTDSQDMYTDIIVDLNMILVTAIN